MILPLEKSKIEQQLAKQIILIYGRAKIGKSTLASKFSNPLFLATEPGLNHLEVFKVNINSWEKFLEACAEIAAGKHEFKTIVIDTVDNLLVFCSDWVCKKNNINHPSELPHGKGWHLVTSEVNRALVKLSQLSYGLVLISHCELEEVETPAKKYNRWTISVSGKNRNIFLNMADMILFIDSKLDENKKEVRIIRTKPSLYYEAGDRSMLLPDELPLSYEELNKHFKGGV